MRAFVPFTILRPGLKTRAHWQVPFPEAGLKTRGHHLSHPSHLSYFIPMFAAANAHWSARSAISLSVGR